MEVQPRESRIQDVALRGGRHALPVAKRRETQTATQTNFPYILALATSDADAGPLKSSPIHSDGKRPIIHGVDQAGTGVEGGSHSGQRPSAPYPRCTPVG